jgi:uncharacterized protein YjdB
MRVTLGETFTLDVSVFPTFDNPTVVWSSSDPAVAAVDNGAVTTVGVGSCAITATVGNVSDSVTLTVYIPVSGFELSDTEVWVLSKKEWQLSVESVEPAGAEALITWVSSDDSVAVVDENGLLTTKKPGDATITASNDNGITRQALIHVCYPVTAISFEENEVSAVRLLSCPLTANVTMRTQSCVNKLVTFTSSDETIVTVGSDGVITGVSVGTATITATAESGVSATCTVTVREPFMLTLPSATTEIGSRAFAGLTGAEIVVLPAGVTYIAPDAFDGSTCVLSVAAGSYAESRAIEIGMPCIVRQAD